MKRIIIFLSLSMTLCVVNAQPGKVKTAASSPLKTFTDSVNYAIGISVANFYRQLGATKLNTVLVSKAINDVMANKKTVIDEETANQLMNRYMTEIQKEKVKPNIQACETFLAKNKTKPGVITTPSGLQYEVLREGTGPKPKATDQVVCNYKGSLLDGTEFDNSYSRGQPATFSLQEVVGGWTEGIQLMSVGAKFKFYIPYNLGYKLFDHGTIPGGSCLIFEVELLDIKK